MDSNSTLPASRLDAESIDLIAQGAGILGSGGGGSTYLGRLLAQSAIGRGSGVRIVALDAVKPGSLVVCIAQVGAPVVLAERLGRGTEAALALATLEEHLGERAVAVACEEIGGVNSLVPMLVAAQRDLPLLDADAMGRAFPSLFQTTMAIYGADPLPVALSDDEGNTLVFHAVDQLALERLGRAATIAMGGLAYMAQQVPRDIAIDRVLIPGSYSRAYAIGLALTEARGRADLTSLELGPGGRVLYSGMIQTVERRPANQGMLTITGQGRGFSGALRIGFQTEYLLAWRGDELLAATPDVIAIVDDETGEPVSTEAVQVGLRVVALSLDAGPRLTTPQALARLGPTAFGFDEVYPRPRTD